MDSDKFVAMVAALLIDGDLVDGEEYCADGNDEEIDALYSLVGMARDMVAERPPARWHGSPLAYPPGGLDFHPERPRSSFYHSETSQGFVAVAAVDAVEAISKISDPLFSYPVRSWSTPHNQE